MCDDASPQPSMEFKLSKITTSFEPSFAVHAACSARGLILSILTIAV